MTDFGKNYELAKILYVDSKDRLSGQTITKFTLPNTRESRGYCALGPYSLRMTYSVMTVNDNNKLLTLNGTNYTIGKGYYATITALLAAINSAVGGGGYSLTQDATTLKVTITGGGNFTMSSNSPTKAILYQLGFNPNGTYSGASSYVATSPPSLLYTRYFDFVSHELMKFCQHADTSGQYQSAHILCRAYVSSDQATYPEVGFGGNVEYMGENLPKFHWMEDQVIGQPGFELIDEWGLQPPQETDYSLDIAFYTPVKVTKDKN